MSKRWTMLTLMKLGNRRLVTRPNGFSVLACCAALTLAACGSGSKGTPEANNSQIVGAGSSFIYPAMTRWIAEFQKNHPGVDVNYQSIGSGGGIQQLKGGIVGFCGVGCSFG